MKKSTLAIIIAVVAAVLIGGLVYATSRNDEDTTTTPTTTTPSTSDNSTDNSTQTPTNDNNTGTDDTTTPTESSEVEIENFAFSPTGITVKKGTTVKWINKDTVEHTVTPDTATADFKGSELFGKDETYSVTFNSVGTFTYFCKPHPYMKGTVTVTE